VAADVVQNLTNPAPAGLSFRDARVRGFLAAMILLIVAFYAPFGDWVRLARKNELYSHLLLIPCVSVYLFWLRRHELPRASKPDWASAASALCVGGLALAGVWHWRTATFLPLALAAWYFFFIGLCAVFFGRKLLSSLAFPIGFLIFMVPFPPGALRVIETWLQFSSAATAEAMFTLALLPAVRTDLDLALPNNLTFTIAPECSGIHSSLVLFIVSFLAGHMFLRSPWKRALLTFAVIPLAILRNGFRIFTIGELCVHIGPQMIDHWIHRHGGPVFFALSLAPFLLLLVVLQRSEKAGANVESEKNR